MLPSAPFQPSLTLKVTWSPSTARDGAVEDDVEGREVGRVVDEARGDAATGGRVAGSRAPRSGSGSRRSGGAGRRTAEAPEPIAIASAKAPARARPTDPGERTARLLDGGIVLLVGHDVLLDPRRHAGETRVGHVVRTDRVGSAQPVDRIGSVRHAHFPTPFHAAPFVPFTSVDVRLGSRYFRSSSGGRPGEGFGEARPGSMEADGDRVRRDPEDLRRSAGCRAPPTRRGAGPPGRPARATRGRRTRVRRRSSPARIGVATSSTRRRAASRSRRPRPRRWFASTRRATA